MRGTKAIMHTFQNTEIWLPEKDVGKYGIPELKGTFDVPENVFFLNSENCRKIRDIEERKNTWVMFYEWDWKFDRMWNYPIRNAKWLQTFAGAVTPQFSVYIDLPFVLSIYSVYKSRWLGAYWESLGIKVIPDICWGKEDTYDFCFEGIPKNSVVCIGGQYSGPSETKREAEYYFNKGLEELCNRITPKSILYYGSKSGCPKLNNIIQIGVDKL